MYENAGHRNVGAYSTKISFQLTKTSPTWSLRKVWKCPVLDHLTVVFQCPALSKLLNNLGRWAKYRKKPSLDNRNISHTDITEIYCIQNSLL